MPAPRYLLLLLLFNGVVVAVYLAASRHSQDLARDKPAAGVTEVSGVGELPTPASAAPATTVQPQAVAPAAPLSPSVAAQIDQIGTPPAPLPLLSGQPLPPAKPMDDSDSQKQIALLQEQVEYLQNQVQTLQRENSAMLDKLANLGATKDSTSSPGAAAAMAAGKPDNLPPDFLPSIDYVSLGGELIAQRQLQIPPVAAMPATVAEVEQAILVSLQKLYPAGFGEREGAAFAALGVIPEAIDTLPLKAALLARQLAGWYDEATETILVVEVKPGTNPVLTRTDPVMALAYGSLWQQFREALFSDKAKPLTTDQRLARLAMIGGDAAQLRLLYQLKNPKAETSNELPLDDPDHPLNQVPLPAYLRSLAIFPMTDGLQFAQALHSIGGYTQVDASYQRLPVSTAEVLDTERYFADPRAPEFSIRWDSIALAGSQPLWDDTLGVAGIIQLLARYNEPDAASAATQGWQTDRWLAYANATAGHRGHVVWQTQWATADDATRFYQALRECLVQQYRQPEPAEPASAQYGFRTSARAVSLLRLDQPQPSVLYIDAGDEAFPALRDQFIPAEKRKP